MKGKISPGNARNLGARNTSSGFIFFLDGDTLLDPDFLVKGIRQGSIGELIRTSGRKDKSLASNYFLAALGGSLWYFQFFFYGLGHVRMGNFMFASWGIHMTMLIFFSYLVGLIMKEWQEVRKATYRRLLFALFTLILSFTVITYGTIRGEEDSRDRALIPGGSAATVSIHPSG